ncbi:MAG TPA: GntR family transcriptional regulator [Devosia sp.]|nr:GntR family transcriptional regulator [Devosia sp.]
MGTIDIGTRGRSAYREILDAIRKGVYKSGDRLREEEVAQRLGVSRTPVREAFGRLVEKGLLQPAPGRGLEIASLDMGEVFELYAVRGELEGLVARFAAQHATDAEISNFRRLNEQFAAARSADEAAQLNRQFHARLYDAARNRYLRTAVDDLHETVALLPVTTFTHETRLAAAVHEHEQVIAAIAARDPETAASAAKAHISNALATRLQLRGESD